MSRWIYRVDFEGRDAAGSVLVFSYATEGYNTTAAHALKPNASFEARLLQPLLLRRDLYGEGTTYGDVSIAHGEVVLNNSDHELDDLVNYGFDIQDIYMWRVDPANLDTDYIEFVGSMETVTLDEQTVTILVRDMTYLYDKALQPKKYLGNNVLPNGLEGTAVDIGGKPKPICVGKCFNIEPVLVNTSRLIYQYHDDELGTIQAVYDKRSPLVAGVGRTIAEMQAGATVYAVSAIDLGTDVITFTAAHGIVNGDVVHVASDAAMPAPLLDTAYYYARSTAADKITLHPAFVDAITGLNKINLTSVGSGAITVAKNRTAKNRYDFCSAVDLPALPGGSFIRLGLLPVGRITMDATGSHINYPTTNWDDVARTVFTRIPGIPSLDYNQIISPLADVEVGFFWKDEITAYAALLEVMRSVNASFHVYPDRSAPTVGVYRALQRLEPPGPPVRLVLDESNILPGTFRRVQSADRERGVPPWRINVNYQKNFTLMSATDLADVALSELAFAEQEYRTVNADTAAVKTMFPGAPELTVDTNITTQLAASGHGSYLGGLYSSNRGMYTCSVMLEEILPLVMVSPAIPGLLLGESVHVTFPRFDFHFGGYLTVLGFTLNYQAGTVDLTLWG